MALLYGSDLSADSPLSPGRFHHTLTLSGIPGPAILFRILRASLTSMRWLSRDRILKALPRMALPGVRKRGTGP